MGLRARSQRAGVGAAKLEPGHGASHTILQLYEACKQVVIGTAKHMLSFHKDPASVHSKSSRRPA